MVTGLRGLAWGPDGQYLYWYGHPLYSRLQVALAVWDAIDGDSLGDVERSIMRKRVFG